MQRSKLACDACHRRKVKCNGLQKCQQCIHLGLECCYNRSYSSPKSRNGNKRGGVIDSLRPKALARPHREIAISPANATPATTPSPSLPLKNTVSRYTTDPDSSFFQDLAQDYETFVFAFIPIISKDQFLQLTGAMHHDREASALIHALTAMILNMRPCPDQSYDSVRSEVMKFITRALEIRGPIMPLHKLSTRTAMISTLISACLLAHHADHDITTFYLREAITCVEILRSQSRSQAIEHPEKEAEQVRISHTRDINTVIASNQLERLYWLLFVHERFAAVSLFRKPTLPTPIDPFVVIPELDETIYKGAALPRGIHHWFTSIVRLFAVLDQTFIDNWTSKNLNPPSFPSSSSLSSSTVDFTWIQAKQAHLSHVMDRPQHQQHGQHAEDYNRELHLSDMQQVDLIATDLWLRTLLWRIALSNLLLTSDSDSSAAVDSTMSIFFPLHLSRQLQGLLASISCSAFEVHGTGMLEKIFDVTNTLADILISIPVLTNRADSMGHITHFILFRNYLFGMLRFGDAERKILQEKCEDLYRVCVRGRSGLDLQNLQDLFRLPT